MLNLDQSIEKLADIFNKIPFKDLNFYRNGFKVQNWLGDEKDDVMICVLKSKHTQEDYHRQNYFFFNYAYKNNYEALSQKYNNLIEIKENECYFSQPDCGYAININNVDSDSIIVGVLIKKEAFFKEYLTIIASSDTLFNFFLTPEKNNFSEEFIKLDFSKDKTMRKLLDLMTVEYANEDNQEILKSYTLSLLLLIARAYKRSKIKTTNVKLIDEILQYIGQSPDNLSLQELADYFGYHPNYISNLIHKKTGKKFSELKIDSRMQKAKMLLSSTSLSVEDISNLLGYSDPSNFYKQYKKYYKVSPREKVA